MVTNSTIIHEEKIKIFPIENYDPEYIQKGNDGILYKISDEHAAKIAYPGNSFQPIAKEHDISKILYENGISVPKPEGIFDVKINNNSHKAFVMQYVKGATMKELLESRRLQNELGLDFDDVIDMQKQYCDELGKARNLGFCSGDASFINCLCSPKEKKAYLIDFAHWGGLSRN